MSLDNEETILPPEMSDDGKTRRDTLLPNQIVGNYKVIRLLGRGGMGEVYAVEHIHLNSLYALKVIHPEILNRSDSTERFRREARVMAKLKHANIVHVDDFLQSEELSWLRMQLVKGGTLAERIRASGGRLSEVESREVLRQVLEGLVYAHGQGVVHRDLKPANILVAAEEPEGGTVPVIKIADFGLVRLAGEQWLQTQVQETVALTLAAKPATDASSSGRDGSKTQALMGTYAFMSPEQRRGDPVDARSDLYAIGLMAYQMLTGEESIGMRRPTELVTGLSPDWDQWILQALESDPRKRFQSAREMLAALPKHGNKPATALAPLVNRKRLIGAATLALIAGLSATAYWWIAQREQTAQQDIRELFAQLEESPAETIAAVDRSSSTKLPVEQTAEPTIVQEPPIAWQQAEREVEETPAPPPSPAAGGQLELRTLAGAEAVAIDARGQQILLGRADPLGILSSATPLPAGEYQLLIRADGHINDQLRIAIVDDRVTTIERMLRPSPGELRISSTPIGATVAMRSGSWTQSGATPLIVRDVPTGETIDISSVLSGYRGKLLQLTLRPGETRSIVIGPLAPLAGDLLLNWGVPTTPLRQALQVFVGDRSVTGTWQSNAYLINDLPAGRQTLRVRHPQYEDHSEQIIIEDREVTELTLTPLLKPVSRPPQTATLETAAPVNRTATSPAPDMPGAATAPPQPGSNFSAHLSGSAALQMVWIRPGRFNMGSPAGESGRDRDEGPRTQVLITEGFWLGKFEITRAQWLAVMQSNPAEFNRNRDDLPVERISWQDAVAFCRRLTEQERSAGRLPPGYRYSLPSEAQWEYAARAGSDSRFSAGDSIEDMANAAWYADNSAGSTRPVGQKAANAWGLHDMHGNVWEWCLDRPGGYPGGVVADPVSTTSGIARIFRGGSWRSPAVQCRVAYRGRGNEDFVFDHLGMRVALVVDK